MKHQFVSESHQQQCFRNTHYTSMFELTKNMLRKRERGAVQKLSILRVYLIENRRRIKTVWVVTVLYFVFLEILISISRPRVKNIFEYKP
jgi:hypothetical protein